MGSGQGSAQKDEQGRTLIVRPILIQVGSILALSLVDSQLTCATKTVDII